jgi:pilus assembly protein CpaB
VHTLRRIAAGLLALSALLLALQPPPEAEAGPAEGPAVVAATDLAAGTALAAGDLTVVRLPVALMPAGVAVNPVTLAGRRLAGSVRAGEVLTDVRLVGPGLTTGLPGDQVAAPVRLADLAVAGLVRTGDRVDVLATAPDAAAAEVVAGNALVLAAPEPAADPATGDGGGLLVLAVDDVTAARLAAVATTATLTVSLPPP